MSVIPLTLFFSLLLAGTFVALFAREQRRRFGSAERDSLLPLADEAPQEERPAGWASVSQPKRRLRDWSRVHSSEQQDTPTPVADVEIGDHLETDDHDDHDHAADGGPCGCRTGLRPPCVGCLKRLAPATSSPRTP